MDKKVILNTKENNDIYEIYPKTIDGQVIISEENITLKEKLKNLCNNSDESNVTNNNIDTESLLRAIIMDKYGIFPLVNDINDMANDMSDFIIGKGAYPTEISEYVGTKKDVIIPKNEKITMLNQSVFASKTDIETVVIQDNITSIYQSSFMKCSLSKIYLNNSITILQSRTFAECTNLTYVRFPEYLTELKDSVFEKCSNLKSINIPNTVSYIGGSVFKDCSSLKKVTLPKSNPLEISVALFKNCTSLESITIPENVTSIYWNAFQGCTNLTDIYIEKSENSIPKAPWGADTATVHWLG